MAAEQAAHAQLAQPADVEVDDDQVLSADPTASMQAAVPKDFQVATSDSYVRHWLADGDVRRC
jgi:hypothetical protein